MNTYQPSPRAVFSIFVLSLLLIACSEKPETLLLSAKGYMAQHDSKAAIIQIKNALQINPNLPEARFLLGSALLEAGDGGGAEAELRKAMELKHPQDAVFPQLAKALLAQGQSRKLTDEFSHTALGDPSAQANLQLSLASAYADQGQTDQAHASVNAALQAAPEYPPALLERARQMIANQGIKGDMEEALALVNEVLGRTPNDPDAWKLKGDIYWLVQGKPNDALLAYKKALQIAPHALENHASVIAILFQQGKLDEAAEQIKQLQHIAANHPRTHYLSAQLAFIKKDYPLARDLAQQVLKGVPENVQALQLAGAAELELGDLPAAQTHLKKALDAVPTLALARRLLVTTYLRSGQLGYATQAVLTGLGHKPVDPGLFLLAGEVYLQRGDLAQAETYFKKAHQLAPQDSKGKTALARVHMKSGATDAAFDELRSIAVSDNAPTADLALISEYLKRQDFDAALKAIDALDKKQPTHPLAAHMRAGTLLAKHDFIGARKNFERALSLDPHYYPAIAGLSGLDWVEKKPQAARQRLEDWLNQNPHHGPALLALAELAGRTGASKEEVGQRLEKAVAANPSDVQSRVWLIEFHFRNNDTKDALSAAQDAASVLPDNPQILDALGRAQLLSGEFHQAIATYTRLTAMQPQSPILFRRLANAQLAAKDTDAASNSLRQAIALQPDFLEAQRVLIGLYVANRKFQDAALIARAVQSTHPKEAAGYALEGDIRSAEKNWDAAIAAYRVGLKLVNTTELALKVHSALWDSGNPAEADRFSKRWKAEHPNDVAFLFYLGDFALAHKDYSIAESYYRAVITLQPDSATAYNNLAWVSAKLNKEEAMAYAEKAVALAPKQPTFMDTLAMLRSQHGDYAQAVELQTQALALQPLNPMLRLNLAKIHLKGGKQDLAKNELNELRKLGNQFPAHLEVTALLKEL